MADDAPRRDAALVALDWGTTSFRGWLLGADGEVVDEVRTDDGTLRCSAGAGSAPERATAFERALVRLCGPWLDRHPGLPVLAAGMVGSNHGWADAGYLDVPASLTLLADHLTPVPLELPGEVPAAGAVVHLVPGLRVTGPDPDVLRGEEVQLLGALDAVREEGGVPLARAVLPGTHSKWVRLDGDVVTGFGTVMTGELYGLLLRDSILARLADGGPDGGATPPDLEAFDRGLDAEARRGDEQGLAALLFTARTLVMAGTLRAAQVADYVSGLLVGSEVRHALRADPARLVTVCASQATARRYQRALEHHGATAHVVGEDVAARGLWRVARDAGLVTPERTGTRSGTSSSTEEGTS